MLIENTAYSGAVALIILALDALGLDGELRAQKYLLRYFIPTYMYVK